MLRFLAVRLAYVIPTLFAVSLISFFTIQLPPGHAVTAQIARLEAQGETVDPAMIQVLRDRYGLGDPFLVQYGKWMGNIIFHGDLGLSFLHQRPVAAVIGERLPLTLVLGLVTLLFTWIIALPAGVYSAIRQNSVVDYVVSGLGFIALAIPGFLAALLLAYLGFVYFGHSLGGLFSAEYVNAAWSWTKLKDLLAHLWVPVLVLSL